MSALVIDSSATLSWCFEDEASPESDALFEWVRDQGAVVPGLWHLEVANVLLQAERHGRITTGDVAMRLELIAELPISARSLVCSGRPRRIASSKYVAS